MIRIRGPLKVGQVAAHAVRGRALVPSPDVAACADELGVRAGQREAGGGVIEPGIEPCIHAVTLLASRGETSGHVIGAGGLLIGGRVTRVALRRQPLELAGGRAFMAGGTIERGVRSNQREAVLVIADGLD